MADIILHHYDFSPFAEKIRLGFGLKSLPWRSVQIELMPPRPLLDVLTGGYRRVPVMQIGADIYCDTEIIFRALERLQPSPTLYPTGEGLSKALSFWWDRFTWKPAIGILVHHLPEDLPEAFLKDRREQYLGYDMSKAAMAPKLPVYLQQMTAFAEWVASMLGRNGPYLTGEEPSAADITCYHSLWLLRSNACAEQIDAQLRLAPLVPWMDRVAALGHGSRTEMTSEEAVTVARETAPAAPGLPADGDPSGIRAGTRVTVTPDDNARVPVAGELVAADAQEIIIRRESPETGAVHVHFPRAGFETLLLATTRAGA